MQSTGLASTLHSANDHRVGTSFAYRFDYHSAFSQRDAEDDAADVDDADVDDVDDDGGEGEEGEGEGEGHAQRKI